MAKEVIEGLPELVRKLNQLPTETGGKILRQTVGFAATPVVNNAKLRIPVRDDGRVRKTYKGNLVGPGFAKRSIAKRTRIIDGRAVAMIGVKREAYYATQFVELGTKHQEAQEWLRPALESQQPAVLNRITEGLRRRINKVARS